MAEANNRNIQLESVVIDQERYFKITNSDQMRPFFMSIVSSSNHWLFMSSNGGLTAGRKNAEFPLFPYYTDDKITESAEITGGKSIFRVVREDKKFLWEPFSIRQDGLYHTSQNVYKSEYGHKVILEEINYDLQLSARYSWSSSNNYGFIRTTTLVNHSDKTVQIELLDGIQNIMPAAVGSYLQNNTSNLVDAYKRTELDLDSGLGIYALSAVIVDKAEPSEALKASVAWSMGLNPSTILLSSLQLEDFRRGRTIHQELDVKAEKGAYLIVSEIEMNPGASKSWDLIANVNQSQSDVIGLIHRIKNDDNLLESVKADIHSGTHELISLNAASDALQLTRDDRRDARHFSNVLFNIMRGGIFDNNYTIERWDFIKHIQNSNQVLAQRVEKVLNDLPEIFNLITLQGLIEEIDDLDFKRLATEYMPLKFSRRHGDPSRPWNKFSINTTSEIDGSKILDYEGNWRDIFQNWEALAHAYPAFISGMIYKFLNASTFDGYNPYRVTRDGFDWEIVEPDDPWSYIGYWGDHQIIYLLKFLEFSENHYPDQLNKNSEADLFVYANVPYTIKSFKDIVTDPKDTIEFNEEEDHAIRQRRTAIGADGALLRNATGSIHRVNFTEKLLATVLAKISNLVPDGGIWMNTQRPEWNDANNALVGNGMSMVTLYYLHRFLLFYKGLVSSNKNQSVSVSEELYTFFQGILRTLKAHEFEIGEGVHDSLRGNILYGLGEYGSEYRELIYSNGFTGKKKLIQRDELHSFIDVSLHYLKHSIRSNKRADSLYHAYNLLTINPDDSLSISYLSEMLEGQVAVLSAHYLEAEEVLEVLDAMKTSALYRKDQASYLLYPYKDLKGFLEKNNIPLEAVTQSNLLSRLISDGNSQIVQKDINGHVHFNGNFRNAQELESGFDSLMESEYSELIKAERNKILALYEEVFNHKAFTGRSSTFYGYEGLGSIYWHMVSKLLLAVLECCDRAIDEGADETVVKRLIDHYYEINEGIGVHKSPDVYGAFPTDPYSHTPGGKGAQQPGMTGQVKEDILSRFGELGIQIKNGCVHFEPHLLDLSTFVNEETEFKYIDVNGYTQELKVMSNELVFTYCQVPIVYSIADTSAVEVFYMDNKSSHYDSLKINEDESLELFNRSGKIRMINVSLSEDVLR